MVGRIIQGAYMFMGSVLVALLIAPTEPVDPYADPKTHPPLTAEQAEARWMQAVETMLAEQVTALSEGMTCRTGHPPKGIIPTHGLVRNLRYSGKGERQWNTGVVRKVPFDEAWALVTAKDVWVERWCWK